MGPWLSLDIAPAFYSTVRDNVTVARGQPVVGGSNPPGSVVAMRDDKKERYKIGEKGAKIGIFGNMLLAIFMFIAGILSRSTALITNSVHTASDIATSAIVLVGFSIGKRPPDFDHPYGHGDAEPIAGLILAITLSIIGFEFMRHSAMEIITGVSTTPGILALIAIVICIPFKIWMTFWVKNLAKRINSSTLLADAQHHKSDVYAMLAVLVGVAGARYLGIPMLDPIAGIVVAAFIMKIGFDVGWANINTLMGRSPGEDITQKIKEAAHHVKEVKRVHDIKIHYFGPYAGVNLHVEVDGSMRVKEANRIAHAVEKMILKKVEPIETALVHVDPFRS